MPSVSAYDGRLRRAIRAWIRRGVTIESAVVVACRVARIASRSALVPLLRVSAELERFAPGDFERHALAVDNAFGYGQRSDGGIRIWG